MAHTGKEELLLGGGVACNERLREMSQIMCGERGGESFWPARPFCVDNGTMIAELGRRMIDSGTITSLTNSAVSPGLRTDHTIVTWD